MLKVWTQRFSVVSIVWLVLWGWTPAGSETLGACVVETSPATPTGPLVRHLTEDCSPTEREANAVSSRTVMEAMANGRPVDLVGVVIHGDLSFDALPVQTTQLPKGLTPEQQAALVQLNSEELRVVSVAVTIRNSVVRGAVRHQSATGTLQFTRPVNFQRTVFAQGIDLSRSVFQGAVDMSGATFEKEAFFVYGHFGHMLNCKETKFGPHTRFHRSLFQGPVNCAGAIFDGMAEFLEVTFEAPVNLAMVRFGSGTGFSGSRFHRHVNFSEAIFSRDAFFTFSNFEGDAIFADAQFLAHADFSDAQFHRPDDLLKARFDQQPVLTRTKRASPEEPTALLQSSGAQYAVTLFFLLMAAFLVAYAFKIK